ncbi:hypothetical protein FRAHR75_890029 [Frankia sp. Hr75.2]|nr:hypothetical protein FRAHR75_890029 [Frankia sp. Hr75.2]
MNERAIALEHGFDRYAVRDLSIAYGVLVPPRRLKIQTDQQTGDVHGERGGLCPGVVGPTEEERDDRLADGGAA